MSYAPTPREGGWNAPPGKARRPLWHWLVLGGIGMIGLLITALVAGVILWQILARGNPESTLEDFYQSLQEGDCELFQDSTTQEYRDLTGLTSCDLFSEATSEREGIDYEVTDRVNRQGYAIFFVTETYTLEGEQVEVALRYYVERTGGQWDLAGIELVEESGDAVAG